MQLVWFLPVAFVAGIDGFGLFVPYLLVVLSIAAVARQLKKMPRHGDKPVLVPVPPPSIDFSELEAAPA